MNATKKYCKAVAKELICSKTTKDSFINGLKEELAQFKFSENISEIEAVYGTPLQTAEEFQQNVSAEERAKALKKNKIIKWVLICIGLALILFGTWYICKSVQYAPTHIIDTITEG